MSKSAKKIVNYSYLLIMYSCVIVFVILEWLRVVSMKNWDPVYALLQKQTMPSEVKIFFYDVFRDLAIALVPVALVLFFWEYILRGARYEEILEIFDSRNQHIKKIEDSGLIDIVSSISDDYLVDFVDKAKHEIRILAPWFMDPYILERVFKDKVKKSYFKLQIIFLQPGSLFAKHRGEVLQPNYPDYADAKLKESILALGDALKDAKSEHIEVLTYNSLPSIFIIQIDATEALLGLYLHTDVAMKNPCLRIKTNIDSRETLLGRMARKEIEKVLKLCSKIRLSSVRVNDNDDLVYTEEPYRSQVIYHTHDGDGKSKAVSTEELTGDSVVLHQSED